MIKAVFLLTTVLAFTSGVANAGAAAVASASADQIDLFRLFPRDLAPAPLYDWPIPNARPAPDQEQQREQAGKAFTGVSKPTYQTFLPSPGTATGAAVVIFPGGGYQGLAYGWEGERIASAFQDRGIVAVVVKYRLPSDATMQDKTIGPLQDAQQALKVVRSHTQAWHVDLHKVGVIGFSAGGHLAATVSTHFDRDYAGGPASPDLRPDFSILVYPVITMNGLHPDASRDALLGPHPTAEQAALMSNEGHVTAATPPTLLFAASDDTSVDPVANAVTYYEALRTHGVAAGLFITPTGNHGLLTLPMATWSAPMWSWLAEQGLSRP